MKTAVDPPSLDDLESNLAAIVSVHPASSLVE